MRWMTKLRFCGATERVTSRPPSKRTRTSAGFVGVAPEAEAEPPVLDPHRLSVDPDLGAWPDFADHKRALRPRRRQPRRS